jgi:hypothetical protein
MAFPGGAQIAVIRHGPNVPLPVMQLDFLNNTSLNSRITFSRGTNATLVDSTGKITYAPANLQLQSQTMTISPWTGDTVGGTVPTATANAGVAPDGTNTATRLQINRGAGTFSRWQGGAISGPSGFYIASVWMKTTSGTGVANVGLRNDATGVNCVVTGNWQRFSVVNTPATVNPSVQILSFTSIPGTDVSADILVWGAQVEPVTYQTTPGPYVATTASAYYGPRFDYDPVTLAPRGLLIEEARTNLLTYSEQFDNAYWVKTASTVTANTTASPDGTTNADKLVENTATAEHFIEAPVSVTTGTTYTFVFYAKAGERNVIAARGSSAFAVDPRIRFTLTGSGTVTVDNGTPTGTITPVGNGWYRCSMTAVTNATTGAGFRLSLYNGAYSYTGDGTSGLFLYGAQLEAGAFATSYIPTVASTVTRNADVATMTGTNFSTWYNQAAGTFVVDADKLSAIGFSYVLLANDSTNNERFGVYQSNTTVAGFISAGGATQMEIISSPIAANVPFKAAVAATANSGNFSFNGNIGITDTSLTMPSPNRLDIGCFGSGSQLNGHLRAIAYYNTRLPNTQLQTLTAPSLASPLALDFISPTYTVGY